jgi:hypothetical protein
MQKGGEVMPTVGQNVQFVYPAQSEGKTDEICAATVTFVHGPSMVNLVIMPDVNHREIIQNMNCSAGHLENVCSVPLGKNNANPKESYFQMISNGDENPENTG